MMVESYLVTVQQVDLFLSVSAERDALPEQTGHNLICRQPLCHRDSYNVTHRNKFLQLQQV